MAGNESSRDVKEERRREARLEETKEGLFPGDD